MTMMSSKEKSVDILFLCILVDLVLFLLVGIESSQRATVCCCSIDNSEILSKCFLDEGNTFSVTWFVTTTAAIIMLLILLLLLFMMLTIIDYDDISRRWHQYLMHTFFSCWCCCCCRRRRPRHHYTLSLLTSLSPMPSGRHFQPEIAVVANRKQESRAIAKMTRNAPYSLYGCSENFWESLHGTANFPDIFTGLLFR